MEKVIDVLILWGPTIFLLIALLSGIIWGLIRGFRKSLILFIHAIIAFLICVIAYSIVVNMDSIDEKMVSMINNFMGSEYALQDELEVSRNCITLRDILVEYIPKNMDYGDGFALIVAENGEYLATLVNFAYHIILALVFFVVYYILIFIFYIIYLIFYPEGRYRRKKNRKYRQLESEKEYKKRSLLGALVGGGRALVTSIIALSFVGSLFFVLAGGEGNREKDDFEFGDETVDTSYSIYQSISSYGTEGIFKILNSIKNPDDVPYYLFAADLVFQGDLVDQDRGIDENINFRNEFAAYIGFAEDTFDLLLKHGGDDIRNVVLDKTDEDVMDVIVRIMSKDEFQTDFGKIIDEFDGQTYFINLSLSLVDSIVNHIDETDFGNDLGEDSLELINIMFKKGYLSDNIPAEKAMKDELANNPNANPNDYILPYINATSLLTKKDTKELVKLVLSILQIDNDQDKIALIGDYSDKVLPALSNLSILSSERKDEINPVLNRLYQYLDATLIDDNDNEENLSYTQITLSNGNEDVDLSNVDWVDEIHMLLNVAGDIVTIVENAYDEDDEYYEFLFNIFEEGNEAAAASYDSIMNSLAESDLLGLVLSSSYVYDAIEEAVPDIVFLEDISYVNKTDDQGNVVLGEISNLLTAIKVIAQDNNNEEIISKLIDNDGLKQSEMLELVGEMIDNITEGENSAIDYVLSSKLVQSIASAYIIGNKEISDGIELYIPTSVLEINFENEVINVIKKDVLVDLVKEITELLPEDSNNFKNELLVKVVKNKETLLDNPIVLGTVVNFINSDTLLTGDMAELIIIPDSLKEAHKNLDTICQGNLWDEETFDLFNALDELLNISSNPNFNIDDSDLMDDVLASVSNLNSSSSIANQTKLDVCYSSLIIQNTLSKELDNVLEDEVEADVLNVVKSDSVYNKDEVEALVSAINIFDLDVLDLDFGQIKDKALTLNEKYLDEKTKLEITYESVIAKYLLSKKIYETLENKINDIYRSYTGIRPAIANGVNYNYYTIDEVSGLITAINAVLGENQTIDDINVELIKNSIFDIDVDLLYNSFMIRNELSNQLDSVLNDQNVTEEIILASKYQDINQNMVYQTSNVEALIASLKAINISSIEQLSGNISVDIKQLNTENADGVIPLDIIYNSDIVVDILTTQIDDKLSNLAYEVDYRLQAKHQYKQDSQRWLFNKDDIAELIDTLGDIDIEEFSVEDINDINTIKDYVNGSVIIQAVASKSISENEQLVVPTSVIDGSSTLENSFLISLEQMNKLFDFLNQHTSEGLGSLNISDFNPTLTADDVSMIESSDILSATVAKEIYKNESVYVPASDALNVDVIQRTMNNDILEASTNEVLSITNKAVASFIKSIVVGFGVNNVRDVEASQLDINGFDLTDNTKTEAIKDSSILRATISNGIKIDNDNIAIYALSTTVYDIKANNNDYIIYVLSGDEIIKIIETVKLFGSADGDSLCINLTVDSIKSVSASNEEDFDNILTSDVVRLLITQILITNIDSAVVEAIIEPKLTVLSVYDIRNHEELMIIDDIKNNILKEDMVSLIRQLN